MDVVQANALNEAIRAIGIRHRALAGALLAPLGLHPGQEVLLLELDQGPRSQAQLAVASGCEPPTITNSVRKLEAAGLVVRRPSPHDGRVTIVELSEHGEALVPGLKAAWLQLAEHTVALCSTPLNELTRVVTDLARSLTDKAGSGHEPPLDVATSDPVGSGSFRQV
ncbi:MAG TPA: MarR family transcriptional regulator [Propionibacteriaceae bacterium]